jgi:hypothetical protein
MLAVPAQKKKCIGYAMFDAAQIFRVGEYKNQAALLRSLAFQTRFPESRSRLLALADSFDKLAERVEAREVTIANIA